MKKNPMSDSEIAELLHQLPSVKDHRSMHEVYKNIENQLEQEKSYPVKKKKKLFLLPALATVAVLFLAIFLGSTLIEPNELYNIAEDVQMERGQSLEEKTSLPLDSQDTANGMERKEFGSFSSSKEEQKSILYEENPMRLSIYPNEFADDQLVVTLGLPDQNVQNVVPVSILVMKQDGKTWLDYYQDVMNSIDEELLGFAEYYPYQGELSLSEEGNVELNLMENHSYDLSSTTESIFFRSLDVFRNQKISSVILKQNASPADFSHTGDIHGEYAIPSLAKTGYFLFEANDYLYLAPGPERYEKIEDALNAMRNEISTHNLLPSIPESIDFSINDGQLGQLIIRINDQSKLVDNEETARFIDAVLLTAKDFGYQTVSFDNARIQEVGKFNLENPIEVPIGANLIGEVE
ncbi:hypothetical protein OEV98_09230 [Caldibacillus lycopersici]|uniref:GerMN domain-containing protein n=1 Tax=Perspicuibacillus lycopersici TaxID=1325689 RepID=A0AAE3IUB2_9BACI|nr:hypothetical protein [Perspicuibacillus lycopersici]MCU9613743.1 hypothetical protein [Perspicuibacillus lycopersici]